MAEVPSMTTKMATVSTNHMPNIRNTKIVPPSPVTAKLRAIVMDHRTDDNCACASDKAHRRRNPVYIEKKPIISKMYLPEYAMSNISSLFIFAIFFSFSTSAEAARNIMNPCPRSPNMIANMNGNVATVGRAGLTSL
ncbi:hypothetical protein OGAPHI_004896 [Ogataea philodendri]|uniref:Uncharacterized protein n=1 Tax=Ogataea philodendri TaxID=1378263 RepID=A0A9P8P3I4_9ASCO|nr:uncharacterized protein OGAPHI_004896 [Ogataea philodendri]KAH3664182.1 hypothetical protein OGAPHI_004896 [Ogataea philodendri]